MSDTKTPLRVGLIGYVLAGSAFHAPLIATTPGLRLQTVVTSSPERRAQLHREHPATRALDNAEQLLADRCRVRVIRQQAFYVRLLGKHLRQRNDSPPRQIRRMLDAAQKPTGYGV